MVAGLRDKVIGKIKKKRKREAASRHGNRFLPSGLLGRAFSVFVSEVPRMETLEVGFPNSFTLRKGEIFWMLILAHMLDITTQGNLEPSGHGHREA